MKSYKFKRLIFIVISLICASYSFCQQDIEFKGVKNSSETVGEFTGILNVNIPIAAVSSGNLKVPLELTYVNNGLKPNEASSSVGLGWTINNVAVIYKTTLGMEDTYRHLNGKQLIMGVPILNDKDDFIDGTVDGAYDIYTFNIFGYVGKFIFDQVQNTCVFLNKSEIKIERTGVSYFKVTLPNGNIINMVRPWETIFEDDEQSSLWYPDNIISHDLKDTITFFYSNGGYKYSTLVDKNLIKENAYNSTNPSHETTNLEFSLGVLTKIAGKNDTILINYNARADISVVPQVPFVNALCSTIKYISDNVCVENTLISDYYENSSGTKSQVRLKEIKIKKCNSTTDTLPGYKFEYYGSLNANQTPFAPERTTTGIDAWGYYNGASNPIYNMTPSYVSGGAANRNVNFISTSVGTLKKLTYPLGGTKSFEYEQNTYKTNVGDVTSIFYLETCDIAISNCLGWLSVNSGTLPLTQHQIQTGSLTLQIQNFGGSGGGDLYFYIKNSSNQLIHTVSLNTLSSSSFNIDLADIKDGSGNAILVGGNNYIFELTTYNAAGYAFCNYISLGNEYPAGGLRVSKVTSSNGNLSQDIVTNYIYDKGTLYQTPRFYEYWAGRNIYYNRTLQDENMLMDYHVGYGKVTVSNTGNGKIIKNFKSAFVPQYEFEGGFNVRIVTDKLSEGIGSVLSEEVYDNNNTLIKKDSFQYEKVIYNSLQMNHVYFKKFGSSDYYGYHFKYKIYNFRPKKVLNYYYGNQTSTTEYTYGHSHTIQPSIVKVTTGNGHITETFTDYTNNFWQNTSIKNYFISKNIIVPYHTEIFENSKPVQGVTDDFSYYTSIGTFVGAVSNHASNIVRLSKKFIGQYDGIANAYITKPEEFAYHEYNNDGFIKSDQKINWPIKNYNYDGRERLTSVSQNGFVSSTTYLGNSNLTQRSTNVDGTYTDYTYDGLLRIKTKTSQPAGIVTEYFYGYYSQASGLNSIKTKTTYPVVAGSAINIIENITYSDKLGRKFASIAIKGSPSLKDLITCYEYDNLGRLLKEYLPVETIYDNGTYIAPGSTNITAGQVWKFAETKYEASPLSRVTETIAPDWYATKYEFGLNSSGDAVAIQTGGTYSANALIKATVIDGNGNRSISFTDFKGRLICQRKTSSSDVPADRRDTYTHYDNKNRATKVIPPGATATTTPEMVFEYKYDNEDKLTEKKIPGKGWIKYLYNSKDLLAAQQDANHLAINRWTVYSYDANGRSLKSGYFDGTTPNVESPTFTNTTTYTESIYGTTGIEIDKIKTSKVKILGTTSDFINKTYTYDTRGRVQSYTSNNHKNLTASDVTSITYDNADNALSTTSAVTALPDGANTIHNLVESSNYDHRGRLTDDHIAYEAYGTKTIGSYVYNYRGEMMQQRQGKHNASTYLQDIDYIYRANGMLDKVNQPLGTATTGDLWYMEYYYDNPVSGAGSTIRKNGEIANIKWQRRGTTASIHGYSYSIYGELTNVDYSDYTSTSTLVSTLKYDESFGYLSNGSFNTLTRRNDATTLIDNLQYNYVSNNVRLNRVNDLSSNATGHNQNGQSSSGNIYTYDTNGNLKSDLYRGVSNINYNYLDLPTLIQKSDGSKLEMTYDASGNLLTRKTFTTGSVLSETRDFIVNYEFKNSVIDIVHYAQGYLQRIGSNNFKYRYVIKDHLGSTRVVYHDDSGNGAVEASEILDENHYYAYGMEYTGSGFINNIGFAYKFNGIERVEAFQSDFAFYRGLDPILGRWYQVDPKAEAVMGMSPYCAMGNNPVSYSDPDGDLPFLAIVAIGAATGVFSNGLSNVSNGQNFFNGAGKAAFWGAVGAGASLGVGAAFGATGSFGHELLRAGAHAATQGGISAAQGGNFWQGALSGGIGSGISSGIDALGGAAGHQILGGGLGGGIGSSLSGGNFWQGFGQGIAVGAFNHALQNGIVERIRDQIAANARDEVESTEWNFDVEKDNFGKNTNKCNKFVHDMVTKSGVYLPTPNGGWIGPNEYPINAGQWADPNFKIKGWKVVKVARSGDVISQPMTGSGFTGHTGIVVGSRAYLSTVSANGHAIVRNDWGFRQDQIGKVVIRRYVGK